MAVPAGLQRNRQAAPRNLRIVIALGMCFTRSVAVIVVDDDTHRRTGDDGAQLFLKLAD